MDRSFSQKFQSFSYPLLTWIINFSSTRFFSSACKFTLNTKSSDGSSGYCQISFTEKLKWAVNTCFYHLQFTLQTTPKLLFWRPKTSKTNFCSHLTQQLSSIRHKHPPFLASKTSSAPGFILIPPATLSRSHYLSHPLLSHYISGLSPFGHHLL